MKMLCFTLFLLVLLHVSVCEVVTINSTSCPEVSPVSLPEISHFMGKWYHVEAFEDIGRCAYQLYYPNPYSAGTVGLRNFKFDGERYNYTLWVLKQLVEAEGLFLAQNTTEWTVVALDVNQYALLYSCMEDTGEQSAWILSRKPNLPSETINGLRNVLQDLEGVDTDRFVTIDQTNCPSYGEANLNLDVAKDNFTFLPNATSDGSVVQFQSNENGTFYRNSTLTEDGEESDVELGKERDANTNSTSEDADQSELNGNTTLMEEGETNNVINGSRSGVNENTQTEFDRISTGVESDSNSTTVRKRVYSKSPTILKSNNIQNSSEDNESGSPLVINPTLCILIASCVIFNSF